MKNLKNINEFWGAVIRRDMSSAVREEDRFHNKEEIRDYLKKEVEKQGKNVVIKYLDVSGIEDLSSLFVNLLSDVETLDLSCWNTSGVEKVFGMFSCCRSLKSLNLSGWNPKKIKNIDWVFNNCHSLKSLNLFGCSSSIKSLVRKNGIDKDIVKV